ncbi:MAG: hypothetical protein LBQ09_12285 [Acidobacteriaceae bacterium]|jgi:hypothetical protein|nr:hypothetical protein [Acidobacteriaceae bacterium]
MAMLWAWPTLLFAASFQPVASLSCPNGAFVVDARPFNPNEAGSSAVEIRYRYRKIELTAIQYERYYNNLDPYLRDETAPIRDLGLHLDTSGLSQFGGSGYDVGHTLYLPPASFSRADFDSLAECIASHQTTLRDNFARADISGSYLLGLVHTHAGIAQTGIARLIYGETPLAGIYGNAWYVVLVERAGRVLLHTNYTANNAPEVVQMGQVVIARAGKRTIQMPPTIQFAGKTYETNIFRSEKDRHGRSLGDDYTLDVR